MGRIYLNDGWIFFPVWNDTCIRTSVAAEGEKIRIPHTAAILSYNYCDAGQCPDVCGYVRMLPVPEDFFGKMLWLTFEGVAYRAEVFVNGQSAAVHDGGYTAFSVDISPYVRFGCENRITVRVEAKKPGPAQTVDGVAGDFSPGGIYRDVYIEVKNKAHIEDIFIRTKNKRGLSGPAHMALSVRLSEKALEAFERGTVDENEAGYIQAFVFDTEENCLCVKRQRLTRFFEQTKDGFGTGKSRTATIRMDFAHVDYWDILQPRLYVAEVLLCDAGGCIIDSSEVTFGFRDIRFREDGFYLNGQRVKLVGLCRHQSYPYVGYGAPKSLQQLDARILKEELGVNAVYTSGGPASGHFMNSCDALGLLVFTALPGDVMAEKDRGAAIGGVREMISQYRNHPCVVMWDVAGPALENREHMYIKMGRVARRMDPTRLSLSEVRPQLVTTRTGHLLPTKMFDDELHRLEQAMSHARVLEHIFTESAAVGSLGWCMSDYQTHRAFGSGDSICYHGVMDMFRNPKLAAWLYKSQGDDCVCQLASVLAPGDYPAKRPGGMWIFTNCDFVRVFREDSLLGEFFPDKTIFANLPHPPISVPGHILYGGNGAWSQSDVTFRFEFIRNGRLMQKIVRRPASGAYLDVWCSHTRLVERHSYDMALLRIHAVDSQGLLLPYYNEPVRLKASGPVAIVGPDTVSLKGGCFGTFVRTLGGRGNAKVTLFAQGMEPVEIYMEVEK